MNIIVIGQKWDHMGPKSGFPLAEVLSQASVSNSVINLEPPGAAERTSLVHRVSRKLHSTLQSELTHDSRLINKNFGSIWAAKNDAIFDFKVLKRLNADPSSILVLPAAENQFSSIFACAPTKLKNRIFACFHQPPAWFRLNWRNFCDFESLGGIVCLSQNQSDYFRSICTSPICLIKHGVRHDFFSITTDLDDRQSNRLVFVGQWLRDFDTLVGAMELIWNRRPDVCLDCVVPRFARDLPSIRRLAVDQRVVWHADLAEPQLRKLYHAADLLFLPVVDAVANNSVVEALASGLPIVSTRVGGMPEYVPVGVGTLCPRGDVVAHVDAVIDWLSNPHDAKSAGISARKYAIEHLDWDRIGIGLHDFIVELTVGSDSINSSVPGLENR